MLSFSNVAQGHWPFLLETLNVLANVVIINVLQGM